MSGRKTLTVVPAYGRDYTSAADAAAAWSVGKDFRIADISSRWNGSYVAISQRDALTETGISHLLIRFDRLQEVTELPL